MERRADKHLAQGYLIHQEECLQLKELLKSQYAGSREELMRAQEKEDYTTLQRALAKMSDIGADIQAINWKISNTRRQLSWLEGE